MPERTGTTRPSSLVTARPCAARVARPPHYLHTCPCDKPAKHEVDGVPVCGVHKRIAERWVREGRLHSMVESWWGAK